MVRLARSAIAAALCALPLVAAAPALASGPITSLSTVSRTQLRTGVYLTHLRARVSGVRARQDLYRVDWAIGNRHLQLHAELRGDYDAQNRSILDRGISSWAAAAQPSGLVAAMTGDFSTPTDWRYVRSTVSGLLVHDRRVYSYGWSGPGVGYTPNGGFVIGRPSVVPAHLLLPHGASATVAAFGSFPSRLRGDQVAVYSHPGSVVTVPSGAIGVSVSSRALAQLLTGSRAVANQTGGLGVKESVAGFRFQDQGLTARAVAMPIAQPTRCPTRVCSAGKSIVVPSGGVMLLARAGSPAADGLAALAAAATPSVSVLTSPAAWADVSDVTGGKPPLVSGGTPISRRPSYVDDWQWTCGGGCWRTALARAGTRGWLIVGGSANGGGVTMATWARMLSQLGAKQALGFDANNSAELYVPGRTPITGYGYERRLPTLTALTFAP